LNFIPKISMMILWNYLALMMPLNKDCSPEIWVEKSDSELIVKVVSWNHSFTIFITEFIMENRLNHSKNCSQIYAVSISKELKIILEEWLLTLPLMNLFADFIRDIWLNLYIYHREQLSMPWPQLIHMICIIWKVVI